MVMFAQVMHWTRSSCLTIVQIFSYQLLVDNSSYLSFGGGEYYIIASFQIKAILKILILTKQHALPTSMIVYIYHIPLAPVMIFVHAIKLLTNNYRY